MHDVPKLVNCSTHLDEAAKAAPDKAEAAEPTYAGLVLALGIKRYTVTLKDTMPWTFAHPAAVLPLRRLCPMHLNFAGLVVGSMTPDLGYYIHFSDLAQLAHTFFGSVLVCLPIGLTLLAALYMLRKPLWFLLPQPHRAVLAPVVAVPPSLRPSSLLATAVSVVLGAWTHIVWDSFTHKSGWVVKHVAFLQEPAFLIGVTEFPTYQLLQLLSTLVGIAALVAVYCLWLRRSRCLDSPPWRARHEIWRYALLASLATVTSIIAVPEAAEAAASVQGYLAILVFLVHMAIYGTAAFIPLLILCSVLCYAVRWET